jgi:hypothetical protein
MKKKEVTVMNLNQEVEEMEGARRTTGISSTSASRGSRGINVVADGKDSTLKTARSYRIKETLQKLMISQQQ